MIAVYTLSCPNLSCLVSNDDVRNGICNSYEYAISSLSFCAMAGTEYKILLRGYNNDKGYYQMNIESGISCALPQNDECYTAQMIAEPLPQSIQFETTFSNGGTAQCASVFENSHSIWYHILGTGATMIVNTCNSETNFETAIAVFSG